MKKMLTLIFSFTLIVILVSATTVFAATFAQAELFGSTVNTWATVTDAGNSIASIGNGTDAVVVTSPGTSLTIPDTLSGGTSDFVTGGISANAFKNFTTITDVTLASTVTTIGENAFWGCTSLESLIVPSNSSLSVIDATSFNSPINVYFEGNYNENFTSVIANLPTGSKVYYKSSSTGWDKILSVAIYDLSLTVNGGSITSTGTIHEGGEVSIVADEPSTGFEFVGWEATDNDIVFADATAPSTTITMSDSNASVTAVFKTTPVITFASSPLLITYDGQPIVFNDLSPTITSDGTAKITWYMEEAGIDTVINPPTNAGDYKVGISLIETDTYAKFDERKYDFTIQKAAQTLSFDSSSISIDYDTAEVTLEDFASYFSVEQRNNIPLSGYTVKWYDSESVALSSAPINSGNYKIGVSAIEDDNYFASEEVIKDFTISKIEASIVFDTAAVNFTFDNNKVEVSDFTYTAVGDSGSLFSQWYDSSNTKILAPSNAGTYKLELIYNEGANYTAFSTTKSFTISPIKATGSVKIDIDDKDSNSKVSKNDVLTANISSVSPSGMTLSYQWKRNGSNISGATNSTYTVPSSYTDGLITVVVTPTGNYTGAMTSPSVGTQSDPTPTQAPATPVYNLTSGAKQTVAQNSQSLSFQTDIHHSNFAGIWVDGVSRDVNSIATITEGNVKVTLKSSFLSSLSLGEHLISFIAKDGGMTSTFFTLTAPVTTVATPVPTPEKTPEATPTITPVPVPEAPQPVEPQTPQTEASSIPLLPIVGIALVLAIGTGVIIVRRRGQE